MRCPFCDVPSFSDREHARRHVLERHLDKVRERLLRIPERTRSHMVNPEGWAAGALLSEQAPS
jgi:hypothetical protein